MHKKMQIVIYLFIFLFTPIIGKTFYNDKKHKSYLQLESFLEEKQLTDFSAFSYAINLVDYSKKVIDTNMFSSFYAPTYFKVKKLTFFLDPKKNIDYAPKGKFNGGVKLPFSEGLELYYCWYLNDSDNSPFKAIKWTERATIGSTIGFSYRIKEDVFEKIFKIFY